MSESFADKTFRYWNGLAPEVVYWELLQTIKGSTREDGLLIITFLDDSELWIDADGKTFTVKG